MTNFDDFEIPYLDDTSTTFIHDLEHFLWIWRLWTCSSERFKTKDPIVLPEAFYLREKNGKVEDSISLYEIDDEYKCEMSLEASLFMKFLVEYKNFHLSKYSVPVCLVREQLINNLNYLSECDITLEISKTETSAQKLIAYHWDIRSNNMHLFYSILAKSSLIIYPHDDKLTYKQIIKKQLVNQLN